MRRNPTNDTLAKWNCLTRRNYTLILSRERLQDQCILLPIDQVQTNMVVVEELLNQRYDSIV